MSSIDYVDTPLGNTLVKNKIWHHVMYLVNSQIWIQIEGIANAQIHEQVADHVRTRIQVKNQIISHLHENRYKI